MIFLPYSLRGLLSQGRREEESWDTTRRLHANKKDPEDTYARHEFRQMKEQILFESEHDAFGFIAQSRLAFSRPSFRKRLALYFPSKRVTSLLTRWSSTTTRPLSTTGSSITGRLPLLLVGCFNFVTVPGNLLNGLLVDYIGRRKFVITG